MDPKHTRSPLSIDVAAAIAMAQDSIDLQERAGHPGETAAAAVDADIEKFAATLDLMGQLGVGPRRQTSPENTEPVLLGRFHVLGERGRGGFGMVLRAYDPDLQREVALKIPRPERLLSGQSPDDFVQEARLAARLEHPGVVRVYEVGRLGPIWYIASAYCEGPTLAEWLAQQVCAPPPRGAAQIVAKIAEAVHYAHMRGVLHLDLKPENILVEAESSLETGIHTFVTDFGLAGLRDRVAVGDSPRIAGTIDYMSPEQRAGDANRIGVAADVYALGAVLHDLCNEKLFRANDSVSVETRPSQRSAPSRPPMTAIPKDLDAICQQCLRHDPEQRYATAGALATDLRHFVAGEPVSARRAPWSERVMRWCLRKPITAVLTSGLLLSIIVGVSVAGWLWRSAEQHLTETRSLLYAANMKLCEGAWAEHNIRTMDALLQPFAGREHRGADLRGWEWYYYHRLCHQELTSFSLGGSIDCSAADANVETLLCGTPAGKLIAINTETGERLWTLEAFPSNVIAIGMSPDGRFAAVDRSGVLKVWQGLDAPELIKQEKFPYGTVLSATFDDHLEKVVLSDPGFHIHYWEINPRREIKEFVGHTAIVKSLVIAAQGKKLLSGSEDGTVRIWNIATGKAESIVEHPNKEWIIVVASSADGRWIAAGAKDGTVSAWEEGKTTPLFTKRFHLDAVNCLQFTSDGKYLVSAGVDRSIQVLSFPAGEKMHTAWGHTEPVSSFAFHSPSHRFLTTGREGEVKWWRLDQPEFESPRPIFEGVGNAVFATDGHSLALRFTNGLVSVRDWPGMGELYRFRAPPDLDDLADALAYDANRKLCALSREDGAIEVWQDGQHLHTLEHHKTPVRCFAFSADGQRLAAGDFDGVISVWDPMQGTLSYHLAQERGVVGLAFDPSRPLLAASTNNLIKLYEVHSGQLHSELNDLKHRVYNIAFSRDGSLLAAGDRSGAILVWNTRDGVPLVKLTGHSERAYACCVTPDNRRLVSCSRDKTIRWWDLTTGRELCVMRGDWGDNEDLALSPDGWTLLSIGQDKSLRMWDPRESGTTAIAGSN